VTRLATGDLAPDFVATTAAGHTVRLADFRGHKAVVLFFYPRNNTFFCTAQACAFRDAYHDFVDAGAEVIGISGNTLAGHQQFAEQRQLPYTLVSDHDGKLRKLFGVPRSLLFIPGRVTYVIDREGVIRYTFNSQFNATGHIKRALEVVRGLGG
jgi:peroxiredoxin Q/BCP